MNLIINALVILVIDEFWCEYFRPDHEVPGDEEHSSDEGPDEMFRFIKVMK